MRIATGGSYNIYETYVPACQDCGREYGETFDEEDDVTWFIDHTPYCSTCEAKNDTTYIKHQMPGQAVLVAAEDGAA